MQLSGWCFRPSGGRKSSFSMPGNERVPDKDFDQQEMKYDSTGMFHYTPARVIDDVVLVSLNYLSKQRNLYNISTCRIVIKQQ